MRKNIPEAVSKARKKACRLAGAGDGLGRFRVGLPLLIASIIAFSNAPAQAETITFIQLNDLHAHLTPHRDLVRLQSDEGSPVAAVETLGGLARITTLIKKIRKEPTASILMNIGDTYHGGVEALYTRGNAVVAPVNALGIDIGVPGNWDFAYGPVTTRLRYSDADSTLWALVNKMMFDSEVQAPDYPLLGGNVTKSIWLIDDGEPLLPATRIIEVGSRRVGFIGITSDIIARMSPMLALGFEFLQGEDAYREYVDKHSKELRSQGVDLIAVMSELGIHKDRQLADVVAPGVDVFFSAHTHELTPRPIVSSSGALVVEAGDDGVLGLMRVTLNDGEDPLFDWEVVTVDDSVEADPHMTRLVEQARAPFLAADVDMAYPMPGSELQLSAPIDTIIGTAPFMLHRRHALENPFNSYLATRLREQYGSDVALTPGFRFDAVVPAGTTMTLEEAYRYLPAPPTLARGTITAGLLRELFEGELTRVFSSDAFKQSGGWFMGVSGVTLKLDLSAADGSKILAMRRLSDGSVLEPTDTLSVLSCLRPFDADDELCGNGGFTDIQGVENPAGNIWAGVEFLSWVMGREKPGNEQPRSIHDVAATPFWPESDFVQPLQPGLRH
jgi:sulfur-oxidizing protein SoxB